MSELLKDVLDSFGWYGIGSPSVEGIPEPAVSEAADSADSELEENGEVEREGGEEEEYVEPQYYFDPADVQGAVDEAISALISEELIPEFSNPKDPPELSDIFAALLGPRSEIQEQIEYFEELISGYEDRAHIDDLKEAYGILESITEKISPKKPKA